MLQSQNTFDSKMKLDKRAAKDEMMVMEEDKGIEEEK
jgi:hypothetical protein